MKVFLCYASEDYDEAEQIQLALTGANFDVFFDKRKLLAGADYQSEIKNAIFTSDLFIFLASQYSIEPGKYTLTEVEFARLHWPHPKGHVIPVLKRGITVSQLPNYLRAITALEPKGNSPAEVRALIEKLRDAMLAGDGMPPKMPIYSKPDPDIDVGSRGIDRGTRGTHTAERLPPVPAINTEKANGETFEKALLEMSDTFVSRHISADFVLDSEEYELQLADAFCGIVTSPAREMESPISCVVDALLSPAPRKGAVLLSACAGSGREQFAALLYLRLRRETMARKLDLVPVILDRHLETQVGWSIDKRASEYINQRETRGRLRRYIPLIVGKHRQSDGASRNSRRNLSPLCEYLISNSAGVLHIGMSTENLASTQRPLASDTMFEIAAQSLDEGSVHRLLTIAALSDGVELTNNFRRAACQAILKLCRRHRISPDVFVARQVLASVCAGASFHESLGGLIAAFVEDFVRRRFEITSNNECSIGAFHPWVRDEVRQYSRAHYQYFTTRGGKKVREKERRSSSDDSGIRRPDVETGFLELIRTHKSIRDWLVASEVFWSLVDQADEQAGSDAFVSRFDHVFPSRITAFFRDYLDNESSDAVHAALRTVRAHLDLLVKRNRGEEERRATRGGLCVGHRMFATTCAYIAGRVKGIGERQEMEEKLHALGELAQQDLDDFYRVSRLAYGALSAKSAGVRRWSRDLFKLFGTEIPDTPQRAAHILSRLEREILLLQRGVYISLTMLGDDKAADAYISRLLLNYANDDLNRGFHREYYGDLEFSPTEPLLSDDRSLSSCARTLHALMSELPLLPPGAPMAQIQLYTIASLVRPRNIAGSMTETDLNEVHRFLIQETERHHSISYSLRDFLLTTAAEINCGQHVIEAYIDDLYEIKFQARSGWRNISPPESVAAHQYVVERLAELLLPSHPPDLQDAKKRVLELVRTHDIGEAVASDVRDQDKRRTDERAEFEVVQRIARIGALTGSDEFLRLGQAFEEFESTKAGNQELDPKSAAALAKDLDRLDLLVQLYRYIREHGHVEGENEFRNSIAPDKFLTKTIRDRAARFVDYFHSNLSRRVTGSPFEIRLWPVDVPRSARIGGS